MYGVLKNLKSKRDPGHVVEDRAVLKHACSRDSLARRAHWRNQYYTYRPCQQGICRPVGSMWIYGTAREKPR